MRPVAGRERANRRGLIVLGWCLVVILAVLDRRPVSAVDAPPGAPAVPSAEPEPTPPAPESQESTELPLLEQMELPSFEQLLSGPARDWIVLKSQRVILAEPVYPRPGALEALDKALKELVKTGRKLSADELTAQRKKLQSLAVTLPDGDEREYRLPTRHIQEIVYHEDLVLRRVDKLLEMVHPREAYELLAALSAREPNWPGSADRRERLLVLQANLATKNGQVDSALALLEQLADRPIDGAAATAAWTSACDRAVGDAVAEGDYRRARFHLDRVRRRQSALPAVNQWSQRLADTARGELRRAASEEQGGRDAGALEAAEQAALIWPELAELASTYRRLFLKRPKLRIAVTDLMTDTAPYPGLFTNVARQRDLLDPPLFQPKSIREKITRYDSRLVEDWEPEDLGRQIRLQLRSSGARNGRVVTAPELALLLASRLRGGEPTYDERLAGFIEQIATPTPTEVVLTLRQAPLRTEALLMIPLKGAPSDPNGQATSLLAPFEVVDAGSNQARLRRVNAERRVQGRTIVDLVEVRHDSPERALQALMRGEVSMWADVPPWMVAPLTARKDLQVRKLQVPATHTLQFNPASRHMTSRTLRRALVFGLPRQEILDRVWLRGARHGRLTSAPFPLQSYAVHQLVEPHKFDSTLGLSFVLATRKEFEGKLPRLKLVCSNTALTLETSRAMAAAWKTIGLDVDVIPTGAAERAIPPDWDILYTTVRMAEPAVELWPFLSLTGATDVRSLAHLQGWLQQELLALDSAGSWELAEQILRRIHKQIWAEVHLIPLWEIDEHVAVRTHVKGLPTPFMRPYQGLEQWDAEPWYYRPETPK